MIEGLLVIALLAGAAWLGMKKDNSKPGQRKGAAPGRAPRGPAPARSATPAHHWPALDAFEYEIVGEGNYQAALSRLAGDHGTEGAQIGAIATLIPEDENPYDTMAVRVDIAQLTVGYMSREDARSFRRRLNSKNLNRAVTTCAALICGGFIRRQGGDRAAYGVKLDIKPFE